MNTAKSLIIGIHGLGNKPPKPTLEKWWRMSISEGLLKHTGKLPFFDFKLVYWSDYLNPKPMDPQERNPEHPLYIEEPYLAGNGQPNHNGNNHGFRNRFKDGMKSSFKKLVLSNQFLHAFPAVTESIVMKHFKEIEVYYSSESIYKVKFAAKEVLRTILAETLTKYKNRRITLIGHSMGSLIACDVLYRLNFEIDTFITIGSPIGIPYITEKIRSEQNGSNGSTPKAIKVPEAISGRWLNFSDSKDAISSDYKLAHVFAPNSKGVIPQDAVILNDYAAGKRANPHKAYGYLRCKEMSQVISRIITENKNAPRLWLENKFSNMLFKMGAWTRQ